MNQDKKKTPTCPRSQPPELPSWPRRFLQLQVLLLSIVLVYSILEFVQVMQEKENPFLFSKWMFVRDVMAGPLLLLIVCLLILVRRLVSAALAVAIAGYLIFVTGFRGLISVPSSHGVPILSFDAVGIWFKATPNRLILQTALAAVALVLATIQLVCQQWTRERSP